MKNEIELQSRDISAMSPDEMHKLLCDVIDVFDSAGIVCAHCIAEELLSMGLAMRGEEATDD